jgi:hypothetical protein
MAKDMDECDSGNFRSTALSSTESVLDLGNGKPKAAFRDVDKGVEAVGIYSSFQPLRMLCHTVEGHRDCNDFGLGM